MAPLEVNVAVAPSNLRTELYFAASNGFAAQLRAALGAAAALRQIGHSGSGLGALGALSPRAAKAVQCTQKALEMAGITYDDVANEEALRPLGELPGQEIAGGAATRPAYGRV